jgi:hypothetical protein
MQKWNGPAVRGEAGVQLGGEPGLNISTNAGQQVRWDSLGPKVRQVAGGASCPSHAPAIARNCSNG